MNILTIKEKILKNKKLLISILFSVIVFFIVFILGIYITKNTSLQEVANLNQYNYLNCEKIYNAKIDSFFISKSNKNLIYERIIGCDKMYDDIKLFSDFDFESDKIFKSPLLLKNQSIKSSVEEKAIFDYDFKIDENIDIDKSKFELYFSNDNYEAIEKIIYDFPEKISGTLEDVISLFYIKHLYLINKEKIVNSNLNNNQSQEEILNIIYEYQNNDGGFKKYKLDENSDTDISFFIDKIFSNLLKLGIKIDEKVINNLTEFTNKNTNFTYDLNNLKNKYVNGKTNIIEKSILLSGLINENYKDKQRIDEIYNSLNEINLNNYFLSNIQKAFLFEAFIKYTNKYSNNQSKSKFGFMLGIERNKETLFWLGRVVPNYKRYIFDAKNIIYENEAFFRVANIEGSEINFGVNFKEYYKDYSKINLNSKGLIISKEFYNLQNIKDLKKCYLNNDFECNQAYLKNEDNLFINGEIYKININIKSDTNTGELVFEDYIPKNFNFIKIDEKFNKLDYRYIDYDNNRLKIIFNASENINFNYYIKIKNKGVFDYIPSIIYLKENPENISSTNFIKVEVK